MEDKKILLDNINKIHTTELGVDRIKRNLKIDIVDVVEYCKNKVLDENCHIYKQGKNWYCEMCIRDRVYGHGKGKYHFLRQ